MRPTEEGTPIRSAPREQVKKNTQRRRREKGTRAETVGKSTGMDTEGEPAPGPEGTQ